MGYFKHQNRLFEFTVFSPSGSDEWLVECVEISRSEDGFIGTVHVAQAPTESKVSFGDRELPLAVFEYWLSLLPEAMDPGKGGDAVDEP